MTLDETYNILKYAFEHKISRQKAAEHFGIYLNSATISYWKCKYEIFDFDKIPLTKEKVLEILKYSEDNEIPEKEAVKHFGYHISLDVYKRMFNIPINPIGKAKFTYRQQRKYKVNDSFFEESNLLNCYYAGFIAADGCINSRRKNELTISLSNKDVNWLEQFKCDIKSDAKILNYLAKEKFPTSTLTINSSQICQDLNKYFNITPQKSLTLQPPNITDENLINAFICGYIDGDGTICSYKNKHGYETISISILGTLEMCTWIKKHFDKYTNNKGNIYQCKDKNQKVHRLSYNTKSARIIFEILYQIDVPKLKRKWKDEIHKFCATFHKHNPKNTSKGVYVFDLYGNLLTFCETLKEAQDFTNVHFCRISNLCKLDNHHQSNGFMFSRVNKKEKFEPRNYFWLSLEQKLITDGKIKKGDFPIKLQI